MTAPPRSLSAVFPAGAPEILAPAAVRVNPIVRLTLYLFVLSIPFELPNRTIPLEIPTLTGLIFLATTLLNPGAAFRRTPIAVRWFFVHLWIVTTLGVIALATDPAHGEPLLRHLVVLAEVAFLCWTIGNLMADPRVLRGVLLSLVIACFLRAGIQVLGVGSSAIVDPYLGEVRVTALGQNANLAAIILAGGLATVVGLQLARLRGLFRFGLFTWPIAALLGLAIIQGGSRGGLISAAVAVLTLGVAGGAPRKRLKAIAVGVAALAALTIGVLQSPTMRHRFEQAFGERRLAGREQIYPAALAMFVDKPVFGWGPIENQHEIARRIGEVEYRTTSAHSLVLELLTSAGLAGAIPFLIGVVFCVVAAWRARRGPLGALPLALLGAALTGTVSGTWISAKILWLAFAVALAAEAHWTEPRRYA